MKKIKMITTVSLLDLLNDYKKWSDYRIAKEIGAAQPVVSSWRTGRHTMSDEYAEKVAEILGFDPDWLLLHIHAERNLKRPYGRHLKELAEQKTPDNVVKIMADQKTPKNPPKT
jgi:transcriptional regulator with XRE-family HTH domain